METREQSLQPITRGLLESVKRREIASPFRPDRNFILFWIGQTCGTFGDAIAYIAFPLLVLQSTGSVAQMGLITSILAIGRLAASLVAGTLVDRLDRHLVLALSVLWVAMCYAAVPLVWWRFGPSMPLLYTVAAPIGALSTIIQITATAVLPDLVSPLHLTQANSRVQATSAIAFLGGPLIAGIIAGHYNPAIAVALESFAYLCFLWLLLAVRVRRIVHTGTTRPLNAAFAGLRFLFRDPLLRWVAPLNAAQVILLAGSIDLLIFRLQHELRQTDTTLGLIFGGAALGAIIAGFITPWLREHVGFGVCFLGSMLLEGIILVFLGQTTDLTVVVALGIGFIFGDTIILIVSQVLQQERTPARMLGRESAAYQILVAIGSPFGASETTSLAARHGTGPIIVGIGVAIAAVAVVGALTPAHRALRHNHPA